MGAAARGLLGRPLHAGWGGALQARPDFWNMASQIERSQDAELRRLCPLFADRTQEGDKQTGLGRTW
jgi:hypothetical protein